MPCDAAEAAAAPPPPLAAAPRPPLADWPDDLLERLGVALLEDLTGGAVAAAFFPRSKKYLWNDRPSTRLPFVSGSKHVNVSSDNRS